MEDIEEGGLFTFYDIIKDGNNDIEPTLIRDIAAQAVGISIPSRINKNYVADTTNRVLGLDSWYQDKNMSDEQYQEAYKGKQKPILINALDRSVSVQGVTENKISEAIKNTFIDASFDPSRYIIEYTNLYIHPHHSDPAARPKPGDGKNTFFLTDKSPNTDAAIPFIDLSPFFGEKSSVVTKFVSEGNIQITINIREGTYIIDGELNVEGIFAGTINGNPAPPDLFLGNQVKNNYINNNGRDPNYQLKCVCYAICKEIGDLYQVLYIKAIIYYNNLLSNVDKILGDGEQPITADNSLILTPDKPVSARSRIRGIPVLLRYCNASLGIISSIFFPAGDPEKMKEAIITAFIKEIITHNNKQIEFFQKFYVQGQYGDEIKVIDRKIGTFTCEYSKISENTKIFAGDCVKVIENCNNYLRRTIQTKYKLNNPIDDIRALITNYKAHSLFKGGINEVSIDAGMQSKITYYKLSTDKKIYNTYNYNIKSPFSAVFMGKFRIGAIQSVEEFDKPSKKPRTTTGGEGSGKTLRDDITQQAYSYSIVNSIFDVVGIADVLDKNNKLVEIIKNVDNDSTSIGDIAKKVLIQKKSYLRNPSYIDMENSDDVSDYDKKNNIEDKDVEYSNKLNETLIILEATSGLSGLKDDIDNIISQFSSTSSSSGPPPPPPPGGPPTSPRDQVSKFFTPEETRPGYNSNMSPSNELKRLVSGQSTPSVQRSISANNGTFSNNPFSGSSSWYPAPLLVQPNELPSDPRLTPGGKKSRKKNTKRSVNRVRKTKLRKTKKVNKTKLRKTKKNKK
jgi:RNA binding exosome subunit